MTRVQTTRLRATGLAESRPRASSRVRGGAVGLLATLGLLLGPAAAAPGTSGPALAPLAVADPAAVVAGSYIVVLDDEAPGAAVATDSAAAVGASVDHVYSVIRGYAARLTEEQLRAVRQDPSVAYVEPDQLVRAGSTQPGAPWGLDRIDQHAGPLDTRYVYGPTGAGVDAYVIDTGILGRHQEFTGRTAPGFTAVKDGRGTTDCNGHGTHVAGTLGGTTYGVAKGVTLVPVRVLGCVGVGTNAGVIAGVDWVATHRTGPSVANMSLTAGASTALDSAVTRATAAGVTFAVAAGNDAQDACGVSPARAPAALTIGATTRRDRRDTAYSNYGPCLDIFAPGTQIRSAWSSSASATTTLNGTSMASPHVAGAAALYLQGRPGASPAAVRTALVAKATLGALTQVGAGSPNRLLYTR